MNYLMRVILMSAFLKFSICTSEEITFADSKLQQSLGASEDANLTSSALIKKRKGEIRSELSLEKRELRKLKSLRDSNHARDSVIASCEYMIGRAETLIRLREEEEAHIIRWEHRLTESAPEVTREVLGQLLLIVCSKLDQRKIELVDRLRRQTTVPKELELPKTKIQYQLEVEQAKVAIRKRGFAYLESELGSENIQTEPETSSTSKESTVQP